MNRLADNALKSITKTPTLVWDIARLKERIQALRSFADETDCRLLYSLKACSVGAVLNEIKDYVAGFSCSSLFESMLANQIAGNRATVHLTTPALIPSEIEDYAKYADFMSLNSLEQYTRFHSALEKRTNCGLRLNPELSQIKDPRYDPCRPNSKLGVPLSRIVCELNETPGRFKSVTGLHIHTACGTKSFNMLEHQVGKLTECLPNLFKQIEWFNLGGGYNFDLIRKRGPFVQTIANIRKYNPVDIYIEPGTAMVRDCAVLVSTVVDLFTSGEQTIAVLDTTLNHMPEVMVYGFKPPVQEAQRDGAYSYTLAGATCLAGDLFGTYQFASPLQIGSRITFRKVGAYTHGQSHWFNGINLPSIHILKESGQLIEERRFSFDDFKQRCAVRP